jgi:hypothetical protein
MLEHVFTREGIDMTNEQIEKALLDAKISMEQEGYFIDEGLIENARQMFSEDGNASMDDFLAGAMKFVAEAEVNEESEN